VRPLDWRSRLAHGLTAAAAAPLRHRCDKVPEDLVVDPEVRLVETSRGRFHTLSWDGGGLPVVLLHGLNANARYWTGTACILHANGKGASPPHAGAAARWVCAIDQRGHGGTGPLRGGYGLEDTRADLLAWLDAVKLEQVDLVGHSWGGKVAADFAAAHPDRVRRLALVDPVPPEGLHSILDGAAAFRRAIFAPERGPFPSDAELARAHDTISWLRHAEPWMHAAFDANFVVRAGVYWPILEDDLFELIYHEVLREPAKLPLSTITMPTLLVRASFSVMPFRSQVRRLSAQIPQLEVSRIVGEHSLHATNPVGLAQVLAGFLDQPGG